MSRLLQNESAQFHHWVYFEMIFWKQAEVVNTKLSLLLDHLLSKEKTRPEFCKNEFSVTGANDVASNTFFSTSVAAARQD